MGEEEIDSKEAMDALHMLLHCALKDTEYETQKEQFDIVISYIKGLEEENNNLKAATLKNDDYYKEVCNKNKELEKENRDLREDNYAYHQLMRMQNEREYRSKFLKDFQKEYGENVMPDYDEIYKRYDKQKRLLENSIPKSLIKEKIEELDKQIEEFSQNIKESTGEEKIFWKRQRAELVGARNILQELLKRS